MKLSNMKKLPGYPYGDRKDVTATETMAFLQKYYPEVYIGPPLSPSERRELLEELYGVFGIRKQKVKVQMN